MKGNIVGSGVTPFQSQDIPSENFLFQVLSTAGDGTGSTDQAVNGTTPVKYFIQPPAGKKYTLKRFNLHAVATNFNNASNYGTVSALANGIKVYIENDERLIFDFTRDFQIKSTFLWGLLSGIDASTIGGAGADPLLVRWTFSKGCGNIELNGNDGDRFVVEIRDNLAALTSQEAIVQGCWKDI